MLGEHKHLIYAVLLGVLIASVGAFVFAWPAYQRDSGIRSSISDLKRRSLGHDLLLRKEAALRAELDATRADADAELKLIPDGPDIAGLIRRLSLPVDHLTIHDQTFTAGSAAGVLAEEDPIEMRMPLSVEMIASFDAIFAMLRSAERCDRLVRVSSVRLSGEKRDQGTPTQPILNATVELEAIFASAGGDS